MGIVFSGMFGLGLVLFTKIETDQHLLHVLFGNLLGVTPQDVVETAIVAGVTLLAVAPQAPRPPRLLLRSPACALHRAAGRPAALWVADPAVADDRRLAQGGRHHPGRCHAGGARRHRPALDQPLRPHAPDRRLRSPSAPASSARSRASTSTARPAPASCWSRPPPSCWRSCSPPAAASCAVGGLRRPGMVPPPRPCHRTAAPEAVAGPEQLARPGGSGGHRGAAKKAQTPAQNVLLALQAGGMVNCSRVW